MFNRRGFLRTLLAAPVAAAVAAGLLKPKPKELVYYAGVFEIKDPVWSKVEPRKDAFEAYMVDYHQMMISSRSGITARAEGSFLPDPDPYGLNR